MLQLYLLSILFNGLTGFMLIFSDAGESDSITDSAKFSFTNGGFRLILGIAAALTGIIKLLSPVGDQIPILGDLIPALAGIAAGFILIFGFYREHSTKAVTEGKLDQIGETFLHYRKAAGIVLLAAAALHFLFPTALFL